MSTSPATTAPAEQTDTPRGRAGYRRCRVIGAAVLAVCATLSILEHHSVGELVVELSVEVAATGVLFLLVVPRGIARRTAGTLAVVLGVLAVLLALPAFWSGLPLIFGTAAALLGNAGRRAPERSGLATLALVCGLLGVLGYVAIYVVDALTSH